MSSLLKDLKIFLKILQRCISLLLTILSVNGLETENWTEGKKENEILLLLY